MMSTTDCSEEEGMQECVHSLVDAVKSSVS